MSLFRVRDLKKSSTAVFWDLFQWIISSGSPETKHRQA